MHKCNHSDVNGAYKQSKEKYGKRLQSLAYGIVDDRQVAEEYIANMPTYDGKFN